MALEKCVILIPLRYNDGRKAPKKVFDAILKELFDLAGGWSIGSDVQGAFRMHDGSEQRDRCSPVSVILESLDVETLKAIVRRAGALLGQERMYFERTGAQVEFLEPDPKGRQQ